MSGRVVVSSLGGGDVKKSIIFYVLNIKCPRQVSFLSSAVMRKQASY